MPIDRSIDEVREAGGRQATVSLSRALALTFFQVRLSRSLADSTRPTNQHCYAVWTSADLSGDRQRPQNDSWRATTRRAHHYSTVQSPSSLYHPNPKLTISLPSKSSSLLVGCSAHPHRFDRIALAASLVSQPSLHPSLHLSPSLDHHVATLFQVPEVCEWVIALWWACFLDGGG